MSILSGVLNIFSLLIFIRIILSWFGGGGGLGKPFHLLCGITDPYLNYFRRFRILRAGGIDFSPIAALAVLSIVNNVVATIARFGRISIGIILALSLGILWSAASFIAGFLILVLTLRLIAYIISANVYTPFWQVIDTFAAPVQFRISRIFFRGRIVHYLTGLIISIAFLLILVIALGVLTGILENLFIKMPI
jgi:YggT family protein